MEDFAETLFTAVNNWDVESVQQLLDKGVDVDIQDCEGNTALFYAANTGNIRMMKLLLDRGANTNHKNANFETALLTSVHHGHQIITELLLNRGADVNYSSDYKMPAINIACQNGDLGIVKLLLSYGAKIDTFSFKLSFQDTILHDTVIGNSIDIMKLFLKFNLNIDEKNKFGDTALFYAARENQTAMLELLLDHGANVHETNHLNLCIVYVAYLNGNGEILKFLVQYRVDFNRIHPNGFTALTAAFQREFENRNGPRQIESASLAFTQCVVQLQFKNIPTPDYILNEINAHEELSSYREKCKDELVKMKGAVVEDSTVSFFDLLMSNDSNHLAACARNDHVMQTFNSQEYKSMFPCYHSVLKNQFRRGLYRKLLLDKVKYFFPAVASVRENEGLPILPNTCTCNIYSFFTSLDLKGLIKVCDPFNVFDIEICDIR